MKKWLFLLAIPFFFFSNDVYASTELSLGGTYKCYNGSTLQKTGENTWDTSDYPNYIRNYINCGSNWTKVNVEIPNTHIFSTMGLSLPYSWFFSTSGGMENWDVIELNSNLPMLTADNYIAGYTIDGDSLRFSLINNGDPKSSFWLWFPTIEELSTADLAAFKSSIETGDLPSQFSDLENSLNQSTQDILNNQNQTTQDIIDNQDKNNQEVVDSIKGECTMQPGKNLLNESNIMRLGQTINGVTITYSNGNLILNGTSSSTYDVYLAQKPSNNGTLIDYLNSNSDTYRLSNNLGLENYIRVTSGYKMNTFTTSSDEQVQYMFVRIPSGKTYSNTILNIQLEKGTSATTYEPYKEKEVCEGGLTGGINDVNDSVNDLNNSINNSDIDSSGAESFFNNFQDNDYGLSSIITSPLEMIRNITSKTCKPLKLEVPYVDSTLELPCMSEVYEKNFGGFYSVYKTIVYGFIAYYVSVRIFALVKGFKDPENDKIEVMDL